MNNFKFKKQYGQNFLRDNYVLDKITDAIKLKNNSTIVEIGPGDGALTKRLITKNVNVLAFEIDTSLKMYLDKINSDNLDIIYSDFLNIRLKDYFKEEDRIYVIANIPYYITTPIITKFIDENIIPEEMILMVQKEVAERLSSKPGKKEYGAISALLNYFFDIDYLFTVNRDSFFPIPNVDSAIIKLSKKSDILSLNNFEKFKTIIFDSFKQKRKTIKNNLKNYDLSKIEKVLSKYNLSLSSRAEEISYEIYVEIANIL